MVRGRPCTSKIVLGSISKDFSEVAASLRGTRWVKEVNLSIITITVVYSLDLLKGPAKSIASH